MDDASTADESKLPYWDELDMEGFRTDSHIHDLPYDSGILLENLMDPAHIPISHDRSAPHHLFARARSVPLNRPEKVVVNHQVGR
jgi:phenylpropionate dioxygenase-like ring-hydroxylating dioxygenase large terminal subunit